MLIKALRSAVIVIAAALVLASLGQAAAHASTDSGGGGGFGGTTCGQSYTPGCTVTAGSPGGSGTGTTGSTPGGSGTLTGAGGSGSGCSGTVSKAFGCVPAGCTVDVQTLTCPLGVAAPGAGGAGAGPPALAVLAQFAEKFLRLPDPVIRSSPAPGALQLTRLPTWLWIAPDVWQPQSKTAKVPGESVTATATPVSASWSMGDGTTITCHGPGTAYAGSDNPAAASPTCGYTYQQSSAGKPGAAFHVTVTITWDITWRATGGAGGALAPLETAAGAAMRVAESQAVNT
jgi:hypothetical protein